MGSNPLTWGYCFAITFARTPLCGKQTPIGIVCKGWTTRIPDQCETRQEPKRILYTANVVHVLLQPISVATREMLGWTRVPASIYVISHTPETMNIKWAMDVCSQLHHAFCITVLTHDCVEL